MACVPPLAKMADMTFSPLTAGPHPVLSVPLLPPQPWRGTLEELSNSGDAVVMADRSFPDDHQRSGGGSSASLGAAPRHRPGRRRRFDPSGSPREPDSAPGVPRPVPGHRSGRGAKDPMRRNHGLHPEEHVDLRHLRDCAADDHGDPQPATGTAPGTVSYTHLRAHETVLDLVCRL